MNEHLLALAFSTILRSWLTPEQINSINHLNKTAEYQNGACTTHNYCDPNQAMIDAFLEEFGTEIDLHNEEHTEVISRAWRIARELEFNPDKFSYIKRFLCIWFEPHYTSDYKEVGIDFFTEEMGYKQTDDITPILNLKISESHHASEGHHQIIRIK